MSDHGQRRAGGIGHGDGLIEAAAGPIDARLVNQFAALDPQRRPLPGAIDLLRSLRAQKIPFGIATSGSRPEIDLSLEALGIGPETVVIERRDADQFQGGGATVRSRDRKSVV